MFRAIIAAFAVIASAASITHARPTFSQLNLATTAATPSQDRSSGLAYRSADDFVMSGLGGAVTDISIVEVVMVGRGQVGLLPSQSKFGMAIYNNSSFNGDHPGAAICTRLGASSVTDLGATPSGLRRYKVTFVIPTGTARVLNNTRYWISAFGRLDDANNWNFGQSAAPVWGRPTWMKPSTSSWFALPLNGGDRSFRITGY